MSARGLHAVGSLKKEEENFMLWTIVIVLFVLWALGFGFGVGGGLIHALVVLAVIVLLFQLFSGRRSIV
jgi:hypothetical protein